MEKCKVLGSLLDTDADIQRRKQLAMTAMKKLDRIFSDGRLKHKFKIRIFVACVESIFLYNSELWTLTKTKEEKIDAYQRRLLRMAINIKWPRKISSEKLYETTKETKWSEKIRTRRIRWLGHALRLPDETPAKMALEEAQRHVPKPRGGQKTTWLTVIKKDLHMTTLEEATVLAQNRDLWRKEVVYASAPCAQARSASL